MSNKSEGTAFEEELAALLHKKGYWVHLFRQTEAGQPADMIAVKNQKAFLIDAKVCATGNFPLSRIEENQELAMQAWALADNDTAWFALKTPDGGIYMHPYSYFCRERAKGIRTLSAEKIRTWGMKLDEWFKEWGRT